MKNSLILNPTFSPASGGTRNVRHNKTDVIIHGITESRMENSGSMKSNKGPATRYISILILIPNVITGK